MSEAKHTPGPWVYREANNGEVVHYIGEGTTTSTVASYVDPPDGHLIAAAPCLLLVLRVLASVARQMATRRPNPELGEIDWPRLATNAEAVIRKATGQD